MAWLLKVSATATSSDAPRPTCQCRSVSGGELAASVRVAGRGVAITPRAEGRACKNGKCVTTMPRSSRSATTAMIRQTPP